MRYERKYLANANDVKQVAKTLFSNRAGLSILHPPRWINNLYFDDIGFTFAHDNIEGVGKRTKWRIRWYGDHMQESVDAQLERKWKDSVVGGKDVIPLGEQSPGIATHPELRNMVSGLQGAAPPAELARLFPTLYNSYYRHYLISRDHKLRVTIDESISFRSCPYHPRVPRSTPIAMKQLFIVEAKYDRSNTDVMTQFGNSIPWRLSRVSKYVLGLMETRILNDECSYP